MFLYLSYESQSNNYVYFDDFKVTVTPTNVVQYNEYYPFGLQTADSWTRENSSNRYLYNAGNELNSTTQWYEMYYRGYDPALGRMLQVDPYARSFASSTPYNYALNSPGVINDPSGGYANTNRPEWNAAYWANVAWQQANYTWYDWSYMMGDTQAGGGGGGHGRSISAGEFIGMARNSTHGGSWSDGYGYLFESDEEAYEAFDRYSEYHGSWGNTIYKTRGAYRAAFLMNIALNAPINLAITLACTNCDQIDVLGLTEKGPLFIDGMILNTDNPYLYSPVAYFNYTLATGEGHVAIYSGNSVRLISVDGKGNLTDVNSKSGPAIDLMKYTSNAGFFQLPRNNSRSSLEEAMGKDYADKFWQVFINGNGYFMTDKPFRAIGAYLNDSPYTDTTFRFRFDVNNFNGHNYNVILNVYYGR